MSEPPGRAAALVQSDESRGGVVLYVQRTRDRRVERALCRLEIPVGDRVELQGTRERLAEREDRGDIAFTLALLTAREVQRGRNSVKSDRGYQRQAEPDDEGDQIDRRDQAFRVRQAHTGAPQLDPVRRVDGDVDEDGVDAGGGHIEDERT